MGNPGKIVLHWIEKGTKGELSYFVADQLSPVQFFFDNQDLFKETGFLLTGLDCSDKEFSSVAERFLTAEGIQFQKAGDYFWIQPQDLTTLFNGFDNSMVGGFFLSHQPTSPIGTKNGRNIRSLPIDRGLVDMLTDPQSVFLTYQNIPELFIISRGHIVINELARRYEAKVGKLPT